MVEAGLGLDVEVEAGSAPSATYLVAIYDAGNTVDERASGVMPLDIALYHVELGWDVRCSRGCVVEFSRRSFRCGRRGLVRKR